jgi:hypothetical protein
MRKIFAWIAHSIVWFGDEIVRRVVYFYTFFVLVSAAMSWVASYITPISQYGWGAVVFAGIGLACLITLAASGAFAAWRYFTPLPKQSIASEGPETSALLPSPHICHVRSYAYFDQLEAGRLLRLALIFLNASADEIALESVAGYFNYGWDEMTSEGTPIVYKWPGASEGPSISWLDGHRPPHAKAFCDLDINVQQNLPSEAVPQLLKQARNSGSISIYFHLQIKAKVLGTGEVIELRPWDGVICQTPNLPVVTSRIISAMGTA